MTIESPRRALMPRRFVLSWCAGFAAAANHTPLFVTYLNELLERVTEHVRLGFGGGD